MTNPLDGNGVCKRCRGSGDINPVATCPDCDGTGRSPAPSQTAVEPVAGELAMLVNWLPKLIAALGSKPEHVDDVARLARVHALIPTLTAQAAALVAAERERDEALAEAKKWWLSDCRSLTERNEARAEVATLKARVAELEAGLEPFAALAEDYLNDTVNFDDETIMAGRMTRRGEEGTPPRVMFSDFRRARRLTHQEKNNG